MQLYVNIETRVAGDKDQGLRESAGMPGVPALAFFDAKGRLIARQSRAEYDLASLQATLSGEVAEFLALEKKAAAGDTKAQLQLLSRQVELGHLDVAAMRAALERKDLPVEVKDRIAERIATTEVQRILAGVDLGDKASFGPPAKELLELNKQVGIPTTEVTAWVLVIEDAYRRKDAKTFAMALRALKASGMLNSRVLQRQQKRLEEIQRK